MKPSGRLVVARRVHRHWLVSVAGEPDSLGTVWAPDETAACELGRELVEQHRRLLGLAEGDLDPRWVRVREARNGEQADERP
jgi:hypothetical protein